MTLSFVLLYQQAEDGGLAILIPSDSGHILDTTPTLKDPVPVAAIAIEQILRPLPDQSIEVQT